MTDTSFSVILLPTLQCDARCDYCFVDTTTGHMTLETFSQLLEKLFDFMDERDIGILNLYWQGGEVFTLSPEWFYGAHERMQAMATRRGRSLANFLQSNLLAYGKEWDPVIDEVFGNTVGTSMDFPNRHRRVAGGTPEAYTERWTRNVRKVRDAGVGVGVIAIPGAETLDLGAEAFYSFFVNEIGICDFQVNPPFPGGRKNETKSGLPLDAQRLGDFLVDFTDLWLERGHGRGIKVGPSSEILDYYLHGDTVIPCFWQDNCANNFVCIDPAGNVSQCDCWVASYPEMRFGNLLEDGPLWTLLEKSSARQHFWERPATLLQESDCIECEHLAICHGGCPVRAYSTFGTLLEKDPYCETYKILFARMQEISARIASLGVTG